MFRSSVTATALLGSIQASATEELSLLQVQARRHNNSESVEQCPTTAVHGCGGVGDTHIQNSRGGNFDLQTPGVMPMATHCNGDHIQFYQCWWSPQHIRTGPSGVRGYAAKFGDTVIRVRTTKAQEAVVCIDSLDGCQNLNYYVGDDRLNDVQIQRYQSGVRVARPSTGMSVWHEQHGIHYQWSYFNAWVTAPQMRSDSTRDVCLGGRNYPNIDWKHADLPGTPNYDAMLFTSEDAQEWCDTCSWRSPTECKKPPPAPPPPTPQKECQLKGLDYEDAEKCCTPVEGNPTLYKECLYDYCTEGSNDVCTAYQLVEGSEGRPICLTEKATDECPKPTSEVCANSAKMDLTNVVQNNLDEPGGRIVFSQAGSINGNIVDVVVTSDGAYTPNKKGLPAHNGDFGSINFKGGTESELTFSIVQTGTNVPETVETASLTYYDLDEEKKGKGRTTVETCDQDETILAENTELAQVVRGNCVAVTSSVLGTQDDNPTSLMELTDLQRARSVTYSFSKLSSWKSRISVAKARWGGRFVFWSLHPAEACRPGVNLGALGWRPLEPGEEEVPEDRRNCTVGGCPWGRGCCMDKSGFVAQSWEKPNRRIRDTCLSIGFSWCTQGNKRQDVDFITNRDGGLNFAISPPMTFLMEVGMFGSRPRLNQPIREEEGKVNVVAFPETAKFQDRENTCIGKRIGGFIKCTSGTYKDESCVEQAAAACVSNKKCKHFAFKVKKGSATPQFALGRKSGRTSPACRGWSFEG